MAGDTETGVTIHRTVKELDAGPIAAQRSFPIGEQDDAGAVYAKSAELAVELLDAVLPEPEFTPQDEEGATYAEKITAADRELDWSAPARRAAQPHPRALAAHRRTGRAGRAPGDDLEGAHCRREARAARGAAGRQATHDVRRVPARTAMTARQAAYEVVLRVFEEDAYADRVLRSAAKDLDSRDHALAQRLAFGTVQRMRTLDHAIDQLGKRPVRKLDPPVRAALRLGAYQLGYTDVAAARGGERDGGARPPRAARAGRAVHERRHAQALGRDRGAARCAARGHGRGRGAQALVPGLDRGAVVGRSSARSRRSRSCARRTSRRSGSSG